MISTQTLLLALAMTPIGLASPIEGLFRRQGATSACTSTHKDYSVSSKDVADGAKFITSISCPAKDCSLGREASYEVSTAINVGAGLDLSLEDIFAAASLTAEYSVTKTEGTSDTASIGCPDGDWTCGMMVTPHGITVKGQQTEKYTDSCGGGTLGAPQDYETWYPALDSDGKAKVEVAACACPNKDHADDQGAPPKCPQDC